MTGQAAAVEMNSRPDCLELTADLSLAALVVPAAPAVLVSVLVSVWLPADRIESIAASMRSMLDPRLLRPQMSLVAGY